MLSAPMLQWLARLIATGLLFVPLSLSLPGWLSAGEALDDALAPPLQQREDPAGDYRALAQRLSQSGLPGRSCCPAMRPSPPPTPSWPGRRPSSR